MSIYYGIVRGNVVVLPDDAKLAEGSMVEVRGPLADPNQVPQAMREALFNQLLLERGLIDEIVEGPSLPPEEEIALVEVEGKPLSEIIIEERR